MKMKKIFTGLLVLVIAAVLFAGAGMTAFAVEREITVDNITYVYDKSGTGDVYYVKSGRNASGDIVIPAEVNGIPVTEILSAAFAQNHRITSVTMNDNIIRVHGDAFSHCNSLASVTLGENVRSIGWGAFDSCFALRSLTVNDKLTNIEKQAFRYCLCLQTITMGMGLQKIEENAFEECKALQTVTLPDSVSLEGTGVGEEKRVSLNEKLKAELPEMKAQRDEMQAELDALSNRIEAVDEFVSTGSYNAGSAFGSGNITIIIVCVAIIAIVLIGGLVISRKNRPAEQDEKASD